MRRTIAALVVVLAGLGATAARAQEEEADGPGQPPGWLMAIVNVIVRPLDDGMLVFFPLIDSDPNRGTNVGLMPVWVREGAEKRIVSIFAPSVAYNPTFGVTGTWRSYFYPTTESEIRGRFSWSAKTNRNAALQYLDRDLFGNGLFLWTKLEWIRDGSTRFFGIGPDTPQEDEVDYTLDHVQLHFRAGLPLALDGAFKLYLDHDLRWDRTLDGAIDTLPDLDERFPQLVQPDFRALAGYGLALGIDTRDSYVLPKRGALVEGGAEWFPDHLGIDAGFWETYFDGRLIGPLDRDARWVLAGQLSFRQQLGQDIPFYALSSLGGKFSLRAFGERRYTDRGVAFANVELRRELWQTVVRGTPVEIWIDPFAGTGTVFDTPRDAALADLKWVVGLAIRTIARPQVVGSIDFGYGPEGIAAFLDIDYSF